MMCYFYSKKWYPS